MTARIACIGECMVELRELPTGLLQRGWGDDTLNTAVYLARLGLDVDYVTALGDDAWSGEMLAEWRAEGIGTGLVHRLAGCLPGLYIIQTNSGGERSFLYWRDSAAARRLFDHLDVQALAAFDVLYLSGITLSIFDDAARDVGRRPRRAAGVGRPIPPGALLPHRRHHGGQCRRVARATERRRGRRLLVDPGCRDRRRPVGRDPRPGAAHPRVPGGVGRGDASPLGQQARGMSRLQSNRAGSLPRPSTSNMLSTNAIRLSDAITASATRPAATASTIAR